MIAYQFVSIALENERIEKDAEKKLNKTRKKNRKTNTHFIWLLEFIINYQKFAVKRVEIGTPLRE